jgi:DNA-binding GntR family transcriptional regulator
MGRRSEKPLVEKIRVHLEEQIIAGRLKPRQRLVEEEIAREMSVSRSPIREALRALEREGLVTLTPGRGACVADLTLEEVDDVYAVRVRLGGLLFSLAARHATEATIDRLDQMVAEMGRVVADADIQRYFLLDPGATDPACPVFFAVSPGPPADVAAVPPRPRGGLSPWGRRGGRSARPAEHRGGGTGPP